MYYKSKRVSLIILFLTALVCSIITISFFTNTEYKSIYSVSFMTLGIFTLSSLAYFVNPSRINFDNDPARGISDPTGLVTVAETMGQLSTVRLFGLKRIVFVVALQIVIAVAIFLYWN